MYLVVYDLFTFSGNERYLFDPRNPKKPILANTHRGRAPEQQQQQQQRFPMDPRFVPPPGPRMAGYRPPFPASGPSSMGSGIQGGSENPQSLTNEGGEAAQILGTNELR